RRLLDRKDIDAVVTATPDHWRALTVVHACQAGKDICAEKPMTLTIHEGRRMVEAVRRHGRVFQTGSHQRSMPENRIGCELIRTGRLGKIRRVIAHNYPSPWECALPAQPIPSELDWDMWCGPTRPVPFHQDLYLPRANPGWLSFRPYSGGEMTGWGSHGFDQVQWALGMDESGPIEIWTEGPPLKAPFYHQPESADRGNQLCGAAKLFYRYANGTVMELSDGPAGGAVFIGDRGRITIDRASCKSDPPELAAGALAKQEQPPATAHAHLQDWLDCIRTRRTPIAPAETGHRSATVCHLGNIARSLGRKLRWDPVNETFPDDAEANRWLDRPRRKPYELTE
ncbi:MAG: Gfo/Idh/MocA family oxidoreductase, partial [Acidobacteria bacterium]|nr:Gfo/Idh/MocA family oxidoreductase [Acidobacteriota bacterium]